MAPDTNELQAINTAWQMAIQEIMRMVIRDMYLQRPYQADRRSGRRQHPDRLEASRHQQWTEMLVKERASNFVTTLLTSFTYDRA